MSSEPAAEKLDAYRSGHLSDEEAANVERLLAHAPDGRRRMAELAEVEAARPDPRVREAVLDGSGRPVEESRVERPRNGHVEALLLAHEH